MLYDRFDDMRSKNAGGSGDGYDLTKIGTTVSVQALSSIPKGQKWEGIQNSNPGLTITPNIITTLKSATDLNLDITFSKSETSLSPTIKSFPLYFWNVENSVYELVNVDLSSILTDLDGSKTYGYFARCNEDGSLICLTWLEMYDSSGAFAGANRVIILEVDKENKTATPHSFTLPFTFKRIDRNMVITENDIFLRDYVSSSSHRLAYYRYNKELHTLTLIQSVSWNNTIQDSFYSFYSLVRKNNTLLADINNRLLKISMLQSSYTFDYVSMQSPFSYLLGMDSDLNFIIGASAKDTANATMYVVPLNSDLTFGTPVSISSVHTSSKAFMKNNRILMYDSIYSFTGTTITRIVQQSNTHLSDLNSSSWNGIKWGYFNSNNSSQNIIFVLTSDSADYIIHLFTGLATTSSKYYGIASKNLSLGDVDTAQLMFST